MAQWNVMVASFTDGSTTFTATTGNGVYVERGSAAGKQMVDRLVVTPWGSVHDLDGDDDANLILPKVWNDFVFSASHPNGHTQYSNLDALSGKHGTLTVKILTATTAAQWTATARQLALPEATEWQTPYLTNTTNWLMVRGIWQLKSELSAV